MKVAGAPTKQARRSSAEAAAHGASALQDLLSELASVLLPRGMTPKRFAELARLAFVRAAISVSRRGSGTINQSRVAAQTGLSRADVKRLLTSDASQSRPLDRSPIERVITGWCTDRLFSYRPGHPKRLTISGSGVSFIRLARMYGGDVPHRALLDELRRIGAVSDSGDTVILRASRITRQRRELGFLSPVLPVLVDGIRIAARRASLQPRSPSSLIRRLTLPIGNEIDLVIARERCASSAKSMLDGLRESLGPNLTMPRRRRHSAYTMTVSILLVESKVDKSDHESRARVPQKR
jgi:hypothetical protein